MSIRDGSKNSLGHDGTFLPSNRWESELRSKGYTFVSADKEETQFDLRCLNYMHLTVVLTGAAIDMQQDILGDPMIYWLSQSTSL